MGWPLKEKDLKRYPHFDGVYPLSELSRIATDPKRVAENAFFPFLLYHKRWQPFRKAGVRPEKKDRPIRYAARKDAAIFSYYRHLLSERYEALLKARGLEGCPIAYRKISAPGGGRGKCNIDFAADAFRQIQSIGDCCAITLDISSYFESIDHGLLRKAWCALLGEPELPPDHAAVFRAITRYTVVDRGAAYERLGFIGEKTNDDGSVSRGYMVPRQSIPTQLCSMEDFHAKICGGDKSLPKLTLQHKEKFGIPQGAPISDLLANVYLLDFDALLHEYVSARGGTYFRYSDDIFIVVPGGESEGKAAIDFVRSKIGCFGDQLKIKDKKTSIVTFTASVHDRQSATRVDRPSSRGGLEYLGFRYDGNKVYIRENTMARFHRNIKSAARRRARALVRRFAGKDANYLYSKFRVEEFEAKFGRVANFEKCLAHRQWTFRTYVKRCALVFGEIGSKFFRQTRHHRDFIAKSALVEIDRALSKAAARTASTVCLI